MNKENIFGLKTIWTLYIYLALFYALYVTVLYICPRLYKLQVNLTKLKINIFVVADADKCLVFIFQTFLSVYAYFTYIYSQLDTRGDIKTRL